MNFLKKLVAKIKTFTFIMILLIIILPVALILLRSGPMSRDASGKKILYPLSYKYPALSAIQKFFPPSQADVLILGDTMAEKLLLSEKSWNSELSRGLARPLKIDILSGPHMQLPLINRHLAELAESQKIPKVLVYFTPQTINAYTPFSSASEMKKWQLNLSYYDSSNVRTAMMLFPMLAPIIYTPVNLTTWPEERTPPQEISTLFYPWQEWSLRNYRFELEQLASFAKEHGSTLIVILSPHYLSPDIKTLATCSDLSVPRVAQFSNDVAAFLEQEGRLSAPLEQELTELYLRLPHDPALNLLMAEVSWRNENLSQAIHHLELAEIYQCHPQRTNLLMNYASLKAFQDFPDISMINWHDNLYQSLVTERRERKGPREALEKLFLNPNMPQSLYWEGLLAELSTLIASALDLPSK
jgi:hypothetical protein